MAACAEAEVALALPPMRLYIEMASGNEQLPLIDGKRNFLGRGPVSLSLLLAAYSALSLLSSLLVARPRPVFHSCTTSPGSYRAEGTV